MEKQEEFRREAELVLHENILRFWSRYMVDRERGGFYGRMTGEQVIEPDAAKGAVLNARILWSFSAAYRVSDRREYLEMAARAKLFLTENLYDREFGGVYWSADAEGRPLDTKKQFYALGFAIYGLSEYARATGDMDSLGYAIKLFETVEEHSFDRKRNGYIEAKTREWEDTPDLRLSAKDANERKTMNTHLHIIEPYTNLYRIWPDERLRERIGNLIGIFLDRIYDPATGHLGLFFNDEWEKRDAGYSYGHDIEASWLLLEAALVYGDGALTERVKEVSRRIARAAEEGLRPDGSMVYERRADGSTDTERHWWVQAEAVVGFLWQWKYLGDASAYGKALRCWEYIKERIIDREGGEWRWGAMDDGSPDTANDKAGFWKCPYHNSRMCLEAMELLK